MKFCIPRIIERSSGVYMIKTSLSNDLYIGATNHFYKRFLSHRNLLLRGIHPCEKMQEFVNKNGIDSLTFEFYKKCPPKEKHKIESAAIAEFAPSFNQNSTKSVATRDCSEKRLSIADENTIAALMVVKGRRQTSELSKLCKVSSPTINICANGYAIRTELIRKIEKAIPLLSPPNPKRVKGAYRVTSIRVPDGTIKYLRNAIKSYGAVVHIMYYSGLTRYTINRIAATKEATVYQLEQIDKAMEASKQQAA